MVSNPKPSSDDLNSLLTILEFRFKNNPNRHPTIDWSIIKAHLQSHPNILISVYGMEQSGGEPDVVEIIESQTIFFYDCAPESPIGRRSFCYDRASLDNRKDNKPSNTIVDYANELDIEILNEQDYRYLQTLGEFDLKTSSWIITPESIRQLGGALFCDRRYDTVFTYHNGASSYYAARGFRGKVEIKL